MASQSSSPGASSLRRPTVFRGPTGFRSIGRSILLTLADRAVVAAHVHAGVPEGGPRRAHRRALVIVL